MTGLDIAVDLGPLLVELKASLDAHAKVLKDIRDEERSYAQGQIDYPLNASVTAASPFTVPSSVLDLGGPAFGRMWLLRQVSVGGVNWTSTAGGTGLLIASPSAPVNPPNTADVVWASTMPASNTWTGRAIVLHNPEHLWFCVVGAGTAGGAYSVGGTVEDTPDKPRRQVAAV